MPARPTNKIYTPPPRRFRHSMRIATGPVLLLLLAASFAGCLSKDGKPNGRAELDYPPEWDQPTPERSFLATQPYYRLDHSSSFLLKGAEYGRYILQVDRPLRDVQLFFSSSQLIGSGPKQNLASDDYHFEFIQVRPLGKQVQSVATGAEAQFSHALADQTFTLTYLYGRGANYQYLAPFQGDPDHWNFEPGFYEIVIATDEKLTIGLNIRTGSDYWTTFFHPQELGEARAEHLDFFLKFVSGANGHVASLDEQRAAVLRVDEGEFLNFFAFADVVYLSQLVALGADGSAMVHVDGRETAQRIQLYGAQADRAEAYAFAMGFNHPGPLQRTLRVHAMFEEKLSLESSMAAALFVFAVATRPTQTLAGVPLPEVA